MSRRALFRHSATLFLLCTAVLSTHWFYPSQKTLETRMPTDVVLKDFGRFVCSDSNYSLEIVPEPSGSTSINVLRNGQRGVFATEPYPVFETGARMNEDWFLAMDQYKRIWIYVGASSDDNGRPIPSVFMHGATFDESGNIKTATSEVSRTGDWTGVPQEFLTQVRASASQLIEQVPAISPAFTAERLSALDASLR